MAIFDRLRSSDWGRLRVGQLDVPLRLAVFAVGVTLWLVVTVILAGLSNTLAAVGANLAFVVGLVLLGSATRTVSVRQVTAAFLYGGLLLAVILLLGPLLAGVSDDPATTLGPAVEEILKLVPLGLLLWRGRRWRAWQFGATDFLLIAAAAGAGFAVVEDAHIRLRGGWGDVLPLLPPTEIVGDRIIVGHAIWTALAGITAGVAWLLARSRGALAVAPLGFIVATVDHIAWNSGTLPELGLLVIALFVAGVIGVIAADLYVLRRPLPAVAELDATARGARSPGGRWSYAIDLRRLRYAAWRLASGAPGSERAERAVRLKVVSIVDTPAA